MDIKNTIQVSKNVHRACPFRYLLRRSPLATTHHCHRWISESARCLWSQRLTRLIWWVIPDMDFYWIFPKKHRFNTVFTKSPIKAIALLCYSVREKLNSIREPSISRCILQSGHHGKNFLQKIILLSFWSALSAQFSQFCWVSSRVTLSESCPQIIWTSIKFLQLNECSISVNF